MSDAPWIYLSAPDLGERERAYVNEVIASNWPGPGGEFVKKLEEAFRVQLGGGFPVALNSGTAALHLALILSGVTSNDWVACSDFTFAASANPILYLAAKPVVVDVDMTSWHIDVELLEASMDEFNPKAVVIPHIYGSCARVDLIKGLCESKNVVLVEDAAEALGVHLGGLPVGTFGRFGVFSLNANKLCTSGGGGILWCRDEEDAIRARHLASQARVKGSDFYHDQLGYNYAMSNLSAAVGLGQLESLDEKIEGRKRVRRLYNEALSDICDFMTVPEGVAETSWLSCALLRSGDVAGIIEQLKYHRVEARRLWYPLNEQPCYQSAEYVGTGRARQLYEQGIALPSSSFLDDKDVARVTEALKSCLSAFV